MGTNHHDLTRRRLLASGATVSAATIAGCIGGNGEGNGNGNGNGNGADDGNGGAGDGQATLEFTQELERDEDFDPIHSNDAYSTQVFKLVFDGLYTWDEGLGLEPQLAVDMPDVERDGTRYLYEIHDGVEFHNGEEMTAEDVAHSFMAFQEEESVNEAQYDMIDSAEVVDDYQVQVDLDHPFGPWELQTMAIYVVPASERETEEDREEFNTNPIGSGPFVWSDFAHNEYVTLERNDDYWGEPMPNLEEITFVDNVDPASRISEIRAGDTDAIADVPNDDFDDLEAEDGVDVHISESPSYMHLTFNCRDDAPTGDADVRRGICHAFSMTDFVESRLENVADPLSAPIPPITNEQWEFPLDDWHEEYYPDYDPDQAQELLDGAVDDDWSPRILAPGDHRGDLAERIVTRLHELGYDGAEAVTLEFGPLLDQTVYNEDPSPDDFQAYLLGWTGGPDPDAYLYNLYHESQEGINQAHFYEGSADFHDNIAAARESADFDERYDLYEDVMIEMLEELPSLPAYSFRNTMASRDYVQDMQAHPMTQQNPRIVSGYSNVSIE
ncbi:ABC transporter substrate-binding protein [Natrarchaeobius chitinivorans]|uniref:ABC transporter substrate-binding protein n=1 Tax=Natrarchaeobius chitinivorans TaxID=1679083 RepID=A0A3N6M2H4_NATCH|nr:ABC transporter substrate-binding protein [Natrarchaeobius chitinivorans]RQG94594.1 ABC transporter substrate-binding protein [Natrarchaeobius chitinivorans]